MKTKIVYVLTSSEADTYLEQTLISAYSARLHNPNATILVLTDSDTLKTLNGKRAEIKKYVSDFVVIDIPAEYNNMQKSRYIKTYLRSLVKGDFLYIDSDTVISDNLEEIDSFDGDLGAVYDSNRPFLIGKNGATSDLYINSYTKKLGWPSVIGYPNYNGGVLFARDTEVAHNFYNRWFELWQECRKQGVNIDMAALCRANIECGCCIKELSAGWNCQIQRQGLPFLPQAKIIHCFTGGNLSMYELCSERTIENVKRKGYLDDVTVNMIKDAKHAFPTHMTIVKSQEAELLKFPIVQLFFSNYSLFRILNKIAKIYYRLAY